MGLNHSPKIVTSGLILALDAANIKSYTGSGTTWSDISGKGNHATLVGSPTYTTQGFSLNLDAGSTQSITVTNTPFQFGTNNFSVSSWVYPRSGGSPTLFGVSASTTSSRYSLGYAYNGGTSSQFFAFVRDDNVNSVTIYSPAAITNSTWYNVAMTIDRTALVSLYINGVSVISSASNFNTNISPQGSAGIGFIVNGSTPFLNGIVATTLVHNRALSADEVKQNFNALRGRYGI